MLIDEGFFTIREILTRIFIENSILIYIIIAFVKKRGMRLFHLTQSKTKREAEMRTLNKIE